MCHFIVIVYRNNFWRYDMRFGTLNEALDSIDCVQHWPLGLNVQYGEENVRVYFKKNGKYNVIIVNRDEYGYYEILTYCTE